MLNSQSETHEATLTLGGFELQDKHRDKEISWNSLHDPYFWALNLVSAGMGNRTFELVADTVVIDTGSSNVLMPKADFK